MGIVQILVNVPVFMEINQNGKVLLENEETGRKLTGEGVYVKLSEAFTIAKCSHYMIH